MWTFIKDKLLDAWAFSRTIFVNVASALTLIATELIAFLPGMNWASVISSPKVLFVIVLVINVANIYLRTITVAPIGNK